MGREIGLGPALDVAGIGGDGDHLGAAAMRGEAVVQAAAAVVEAGVADLVVDANHLEHAVLAEAVAGLLAGIVFRHRADIEGDAHLLAGDLVRVDVHHRDAGGDRRRHRVAQRVGIGDRDDQAVGLGRHRGVDQAGMLDLVEHLRRHVLHLGAGQRRRVVDAALDDRPVLVGRCRAVDDHGDLDVLRLFHLRVRGGRRDADRERRDRSPYHVLHDSLPLYVLAGSYPSRVMTLRVTCWTFGSRSRPYAQSALPALKTVPPPGWRKVPMTAWPLV